VGGLARYQRDVLRRCQIFLRQDQYSGIGGASDASDIDQLRGTHRSRSASRSPGSTRRTRVFWAHLLHHFSTLPPSQLFRSAALAGCHVPIPTSAQAGRAVHAVVWGIRRKFGRQSLVSHRSSIKLPTLFRKRLWIKPVPPCSLQSIRTGGTRWISLSSIPSIRKTTLVVLFYSLLTNTFGR
jgi:hypothetical protein